ncbi:MAG: transposase, partial [Armatimonadetes bacterium]|nr:transposase [Armatimonadota bacterium]
VMLHAALLTMKYIFRDELHDRLPGILALTAELLTLETGLQYVEALLRYLCAGTDRLDPTELQQAVEQSLSDKGGTLMPTIAEQWIE